MLRSQVTMIQSQMQESRQMNASSHVSVVYETGKVGMIQVEDFAIIVVRI